MSDQDMDPRVRVTKAFLHPLGSSMWVGIFNLVFVCIDVAILHWWPGLAICALVQIIFAWIDRKGPYYLRYLVRNYWRPVTYLDT